MNLNARLITQCVVTWLVVSMVTCHVEVIEEEEDFDYDYEDEMDEPHTRTLKKPIPEARNPIREQKAFVADKEHVKEHMDYPDALDASDDKSVEFHFFKTHDFDKDNRLDGLELFKAIEHSMGSQIDHIMNDKKTAKKTQIRKVERMYIQLEAVIDKILRDDDKNKDGYLAYPEFANARLANKIVRDSL